MKCGDIVCWTYIHRLNNRCSTRITKEGVYGSLIRHTSRYGGPQLAAVQFAGNKTVSKVPLTELELK